MVILSRNTVYNCKQRTVGATCVTCLTQCLAHSNSLLNGSSYLYCSPRNLQQKYKEFILERKKI
jgi:hypothetical protein